MRAPLDAAVRPVLALVPLAVLAALGAVIAALVGAPAADAHRAARADASQEVHVVPARSTRSAEPDREQPLSPSPMPTEPPAPPPTQLVWPVLGEVTSEFGTRWGRLHGGIDVAAPIGTPIVAARSGTVIYSGWMRGYGQVVQVDHGEGLVTTYAHQSSLAVAVGQQVERGDPIGAVGNTGRSTAPHLHFETRVAGAPQDPRHLLPSRG